MTNANIDRPSSGYKILIWFALLLSIGSLVVATKSKRIDGGVGGNLPALSAADGRATERIRKEGVLRVGWGGFPPYTIANLNETDPAKKVSGYMIDVVNEIAKKTDPALKVEWYLFSWETFRADLLSKKFDFIADPVYVTVERALDFAPCEPISYFGVAVGLARIDDNRFQKFSDLDQPGITIALADGYTSSEYAKAHLTKPQFRSIPVGQDAFAQLDQVLLGRADVALNDTPTIIQYVNAHKGKVKALWQDNPPSVVGGGFLARRGDPDLVQFLNASLEALRADGTLKKLDEKWKTFGMFPEPRLVPGAGLK